MKTPNYLAVPDRKSGASWVRRNLGLASGDGIWEPFHASRIHITMPLEARLPRVRGRIAESVVSLTPYVHPLGGRNAVWRETVRYAAACRVASRVGFASAIGDSAACNETKPDADALGECEVHISQGAYRWRSRAGESLVSAG